MVTGSGTGIGRNTAVAGEANHLMLLGVDMDVREGAITGEVANIFIFGISRHARYMVSSDMLFDGGTVLAYKKTKGGKS